ncbi:alpha/beta hydrolase [Streptomyces sp. M19]
MWSGLADVAVATDTRLVVPDRPGCGRSTHQPGRRLADWPQDVAALADHLGLERYQVVGLSGGGPYALASAAAADARLAGTAVVNGIGPLDARSPSPGSTTPTVSSSRPPERAGGSRTRGLPAHRREGWRRRSLGRRDARRYEPRGPREHRRTSRTPH